MNTDNFDNIISQPLTTEEGFINSACINELESAISEMPKTHNRLSNNSEWSESKDKWTTKSTIVGAFAMWACRQSPHGVPDGLENVCKYLNASLKSVVKWDINEMAECSLCDINKWLYEIVYNQDIKEFDNWNVSKKSKESLIKGVIFVDRYSTPNPDYDFIDLDALLHNVCITIRDERRKDKAFDDKFDKEYPDNKLGL